MVFTNVSALHFFLTVMNTSTTVVPQPCNQASAPRSCLPHGSSICSTSLLPCAVITVRAGGLCALVRERDSLRVAQDNDMLSDAARAELQQAVARLDAQLPASVQVSIDEWHKLDADYKKEETSFTVRGKKNYRRATFCLTDRKQITQSGAPLSWQRCRIVALFAQGKHAGQFSLHRRHYAVSSHTGRPAAAVCGRRQSAADQQAFFIIYQRLLLPSV